MKNPNTLIRLRHFFLGLFGAFLFAFAYCTFLVPSNLYCGSVTGLAQIIRDIIQFLEFPVLKQIDLTGIIYWLLNIPLFILAFFNLGHHFVYKSIITVLFQSVCMTLLPVPAQPIFSDPLLNAIIGGYIAGFGIGFTLRYGSSGGGMDIVGMFFSKKYPNFSVGKVSIILNLFVYAYCAFTKNLEITVYSVIYILLMSYATDKSHYQTVKLCAFIISDNPDIGPSLVKELPRGVTTWKGYGEFSHQNRFIRMTVVSKYELPYVKKIVYTHDPNAFIIVSIPHSVFGNFLPNFNS